MSIESTTGAASEAAKIGLSQPSSAAAIADAARVIGVWFWVSLGILAFVAVSLAAAVVMIATRPRTTMEWATALISTVFSSFGLGITVALYFNLHVLLSSPRDIEVVMAMVQIVSVIFVCGLPGWVLVRIAFNTMTKFKDKAGDDIYRDAKELLP